MSDLALYPLKLKPTLHVKVWGGSRLNTLLNKPLPTDEPYGESWELHDTSTVANGPLCGTSLGELTESFGRRVDRKRIRPQRWLSLAGQVHRCRSMAVYSGPPQR